MNRIFDDDVLAYYVPAVLAPNGRYERIRELVTSIDYLAAKVTRVGPEALIADVQAAQRLAPAPEAALELQAIDTAVLESARILREDPGQLRGQLLCRVPRDLAADLNSLLDDAARWRGTTWLRPHGGLRGHGYLASFGPADGPVTALAVSDDAAVLLAGDHDGGLQATCTHVNCCGSTTSVRRSAPPPSCPAPTKRSSRSATARSRGGRLLMPGRTPIVALQTGPATSLAVSDTALVYGSATSVFGRRHDQDSGPWRGTAHRGLVTGVAMTGAGDQAVSCSHDGSIAVWQVADGRLVKQMPIAADQLLCIAPVPGSDSVAVGTKDRLVLVVGLAADLEASLDGNSVIALRGHSGQVRSVAGLPDGRIVSGAGIAGRATCCCRRSKATPAM